MTFRIFKDFTFAAAHFIPGHPGKCANLHGHNYRVRVHLAAEELDSLGMVVDFAWLKATLGELTDRFDHKVLNEVAPFDRLPSSAERLAEHFFEAVAERLAADDALSGRVRVDRVDLWENDTSCASYGP
ncbi:MAG: 6-carboxytetrahydropterin synthase QueD [Acidobacteriota bacterium]